MDVVIKEERIERDDDEGNGSRGQRETDNAHAEALEPAQQRDGDTTKAPEHGPSLRKCRGRCLE